MIFFQLNDVGTVRKRVDVFAGQPGQSATPPGFGLQAQQINRSKILKYTEVKINIRKVKI
jgi:hypothetical protein